MSLFDYFRKITRLLDVFISLNVSVGHQGGDRERGPWDGPGHADGLAQCHPPRHAVQVLLFTHLLLLFKRMPANLCSLVISFQAVPPFHQKDPELSLNASLGPLLSAFPSWCKDPRMLGQ